jgi:hypothetical protein
MSIKVSSTFCCILILLGFAVAEQPSKPQANSDHQIGASQFSDLGDPFANLANGPVETLQEDVDIVPAAVDKPLSSKTASLDTDRLSGGRTISCAGKKTGCCLDSSICTDKQYCDDNCQCTRKKPAAILQEANVQSATIPSAKETRTDYPNTLVATTLPRGGTFDFGVDKIDLAALGIAASYEDCGPDKGKCSGTGHCCLIGGSGWCCPKDKKCGEDIGDCK